MESINKHILALSSELIDASWDQKVEYMFEQQQANWNMAKNHYRQFGSVERKELAIGRFKAIVQHNPGRVRSTCANVNKVAIENRKCFLCANNLPDEQKGFTLLDKYLMLVNPFPIFERHVTISDFSHIPQRIDNRIIDMLEISKLLNNYTVFYNGPLSGASAPDHFHFQAGKKGVMPVDSEINSFTVRDKFSFVFKDDIKAYAVTSYGRSCVVMESEWKEPVDYFFAQLIKMLPQNEEAGEPMMNVMASFNEGIYRLIVFPRKKQRPDCYFRDDDSRLIVSPASVEFGGIFVVPREEDFQKITETDILDIYKEVSMESSFITKLNLISTP
jgi:ATP adenylyltransferase/5',5'''-P-1,P-4-tetraphosphate phosphorylase II